jgi:hypothetical protein
VDIALLWCAAVALCTDVVHNVRAPENNNQLNQQVTCRTILARFLHLQE